MQSKLTTLHYFVATLPDDSLVFAALPEGVSERRWITRRELDALPLVHEDVRGILGLALETT